MYRVYFPEAKKEMQIESKETCAENHLSRPNVDHGQANELAGCVARMTQCNGDGNLIQLSRERRNALERK